MATESTGANSGAGVSRRRIVQGAAWATPAILLATAAPAAASSTEVEIQNVTRSAQGELSADFDAPPGAVVTISFTWNSSEFEKLAASGISGAALGSSSGGSASIQFTVPESGTGSITVLWNPKNNLSTGVVSGTVSTSGGYPVSPASFSVALA
ncbi:hypothetical protein [Demequina maris]|uniref:hypothetical protein n=1 Tax=Demequina maris TaxID=1638982 RepID=UPI000AD7AD5B|nr:hypothetical protein [Demequina maris]